MELKVESGGIQEDGNLGWGRSLPVPSIQEIVRNDSNSVPDRYIQEHKDRPQVSENLHASLDIPVLDFSLLAKGDENERRKLHLACKEWGFFQNPNNKALRAVPVCNSILFYVALFFSYNSFHREAVDQYSTELQKVAAEIYANLSVLMGLDRDVPSIQEIVRNDPESVPERYIQEHKDRQLISDISPASVEILVIDFSLLAKGRQWISTREVQKVADEICANISLLMGMAREGLKRFYGKTKQAMRMNYYPPCSRPDLVVGISPHSDSDIITLLLQDDDIPGLQIKHKHRWFLVKPIPNAIVVNVGDVMEVLGC
ncbi:hypothetical protein QUC31_006641 [Theobroma cacao]